MVIMVMLLMVIIKIIIWNLVKNSKLYLKNNIVQMILKIRWNLKLLEKAYILKDKVIINWLLIIRIVKIVKIIKIMKIIKIIIEKIVIFFLSKLIFILIKINKILLIVDN